MNVLLTQRIRILLMLGRAHYIEHKEYQKNLLYPICRLEKVQFGANTNWNIHTIHMLCHTKS